MWYGERKLRNYKLKIVIFAIVAGFLLFITAQTASAASLYFSPSSGDYTIGQAFSVNIYVSSPDQAMNAASGVISFPSDKIEITSLSKAGSIFGLWVQEPAFSNPPSGGQGIVNFEGIVLNPGFMGTSGKILTINFKAKTAGKALLNFSSGSVLANDGAGTNILTSLGNASFALGGVAPTVPEATTLSETAGTPAAPQISSPTHPDPNKWYALKDAKLSWQVPDGVTAALLLVGKLPQAVPTVNYSPAIDSKEVLDLEDGVWYFHVRLRNSFGWGGVSHFRFQIDTKPPEPLKINFIDGKETENPRPTVVFDTVDSLSGIDYYKIKIGEGEFFALKTEVVKGNPYTLPLQTSGKRNILVQAFDKAGNYSVDTEEFVIKPLKTPVFTEYPKELASEEILKVKGKTEYLNSQVIIWLEREKEDAKSQSVKSDEGGNFVLIAEEKLKDGIYKIWAEVVDERGARSEKSEEIVIAVKRPALFRIGSLAVEFLSVFIPLIALIILLAILLLYGWHKFSLFKKKVGKEVREAERALGRAFDLLKEDIRKQVKMLEKTEKERQLTKEEKNIIKQLNKDLDDAEELIRKEIEDIEKAAK